MQIHLLKVTESFKKTLIKIHLNFTALFRTTATNTADIATLQSGGGWTVETLLASNRSIVAADEKTVFRVPDDSFNVLNLANDLPIGFECIVVMGAADGVANMDIQTGNQTVYGTVVNAATDYAFASTQTLQLTQATANKGDFMHLIVVSATDIHIMGGVGIWVDTL